MKLAIERLFAPMTVPALCDIEALVKNIIATQLAVDPSQLTTDKALVTDLGADSLDLMELVMALEDQVGIVIPDEDARGIGTVGDAVACATHKACARAAMS